MPKRIPTPPPADDEPRYLTVVHPYAITGTSNMELPADRQVFARWVACCIDKDAFFAFFHKPRSRGMVIVEINRSYPHLDRILGEHRWSEFLQNPTKEECGRVTQVFYCTYSTGRIVQKNGWKRIDVDEAWFKTWSPRNKQIKFPYPQTHFCDVPIEDRTNQPLCRPLPSVVIAPPVEIVAPQPVVGSAAWTQDKAAGQSKPKSLGAWGGGAPKAQTTSAKPNPAASGNLKNTAGIQRGPATGTRMPAVGGGQIAVKSSNVWQNTGMKPTPPPTATNGDESPPVSRQSTPVIPTVATNQAPVAPPGLPAQASAWGGASSQPTYPPSLTVPGKIVASVPQGASHHATSWGSNDTSTSSPESDLGPDPTTATENDNPFAVHVNFSELMEEEFYGKDIREMEDDSHLKELDSVAPNWDNPTVYPTWDTNQGWDDGPLDAEDLWRQNQESAKPMLCKAHGIICKKGICAEYAKQVHLAKRAEEAEKRHAAATNKGKKGGHFKTRDKVKENEPAEKTMQNNPFRGSGAPVRRNWRGAPRAIVTADAIEKRDAVKEVSDDGWGNSDPNPTSVANVPDAASDASWGISEGAFDPWTTKEQPVAKANTANRSNTKPQGKKKPTQLTASSSWADQVDAELARGDANSSTTTPSKRGSKRANSSTSRGASNAKSSTSGWGTVSDMPW